MTSELTMVKQLGEKMTVDELARILKKMYDDAAQGEINTQIVLFGIKYCRELERERARDRGVVGKVISMSGINRDAANEINAGIKLVKYVDLKPAYLR